MTQSRPRVALKVDVDTLRGTRAGVPRLARVFRNVDARATFLFSVGPDHTGRALRRIFRPGFLNKVGRTSVLEHYGLRTLLYGTLLPGPHIGRSCARELREVQAEGFEVGLHAHDHVRWQDFVAIRDAEWTQRELKRGIEDFLAVFGAPPKVHGAAGWQMNDAAFGLETRLGFDYGSDVRGTHPFMPVVPGGAVATPQIPTTLPTFDELIGLNGMSMEDVVAHLLRLTREPTARLHVFTLHAELEGMRLLAPFARLLDGWREQGYELIGLREVFDRLDVARLPRHYVVAEPVAGRSGTLALQGRLA